jgi:phage-related protein (TIGR01555 family)
MLQRIKKGLSTGKLLHEVVDGFRNAVTGVGTARSKASYGGYDRDYLLDFETLESLFESNDLAAVIVSKIVEDAFRTPFSLECDDSDPDDDRDDVREVLRKWDELGCTKALVDGGVFARLKGNAGVILVVRGAGGLATPLDDEKVTELVELIPWDAEDMSEATWYPNGDPETYWWTPPPKGGSTPGTIQIHETRLIKFAGTRTTPRGRRRNRGWDHSVLQRVYAALRSFDGMFGSTDSMFADASQAVFKLQGLIQSLAESDGSGEKDVMTRLQLMDLMRSASKAVMLDAGDETGVGREEFSVVERPTLAQLDGVMNVYLIRLAAAARMPLTVLLGMSPGGMDATGESDMILYYNTVDTYRRMEQEPVILRLVRMIARTLGKDASTWKVCWPELSRPKPLDVATGEKMKIDQVVALIGAQVCAPEEAALSLGKIAPTLGLTVDVESRKKALKLALEEVESREWNEPEEEMPGVAPAAKASERKTPSKAAKKQV